MTIEQVLYGEQSAEDWPVVGMFLAKTLLYTAAGMRVLQEDRRMIHIVIWYIRANPHNDVLPETQEQFARYYIPEPAVMEVEYETFKKFVERFKMFFYLHLTPSFRDRLRLLMSSRYGPKSITDDLIIQFFVSRTYRSQSMSVFGGRSLVWRYGPDFERFFSNIAEYGSQYCE